MVEQEAHAAVGERPRGAGADGALRWYARQEVAGPWRVALCEEHAAALRPHRFERIETPEGRVARGCAVCENDDLLRVVENCTCETDAARCPEHSNLGCSC